MKINIVSLGLIAVIIAGACAPAKPVADGLTLRQRCVKDFRTAEKNLDIYTICSGRGRQGVFRVYNKLIKGSFAHYIVTDKGVLGFLDPGYGFVTAAKVCGLYATLPGKVEMAAGLYLMLAAKRHHGQLLQSGTDVDFAPGAIGVTVPKAVKIGKRYLLDFWGKDAGEGRFYHYRIKISPDNCIAVLSVISKKAL